MAKEYRNSFRDRSHDLFKLTNEMNVPVLVFSAGLGDCIFAIMENEQVLYPNIKIVSNFLKLENGTVNGFSNIPLIHTFNKNETVLEGTPYYKKLQSRQNVILMG